MSEPTGARRYGTGGGDAYYDAVKYGGYEGTREQFGKDQAEFANNAAAVAEAKEVVEQDTEEVRSTKETFVNTTVPDAIAAVQQEGADQVQAVTQQGEESSQQVETVGTEQKDAVANEGRARVQAVEEAGTTQVQAVNDAGTAQVGAVNQAGEDQVDAVEQAGADQVQAVTDEGTTQVGAVTGEGNTQVQRVQDKGDEVIGSIPADYTALNENVETLGKVASSITEISGAIVKCENATPNVSVNDLSVEIGASGFTGATITHVGKNLIRPYRFGTYTYNGISITINDDGSLHFVGTVNGTSSFGIDWGGGNAYEGFNYEKLAGKTVIFSCKNATPTTLGFMGGYFNTSGGATQMSNYVYDNAEGTLVLPANFARLRCYISFAASLVGQTIDITLYPMARLLVDSKEWVGVKSEVKTVDWSSAVGTITDGNYDFTTGLLTTGSNTYQLQGQNIKQYGGTEYFWSDTGDTTVSFYKSNADIIENIQKEIDSAETDINCIATVYNNYLNPEIVVSKKFVSGNIGSHYVLSDNVNYYGAVMPVEYGKTYVLQRTDYVVSQIDKDGIILTKEYPNTETHQRAVTITHKEAAYLGISWTGVAPDEYMVLDPGVSFNAYIPYPNAAIVTKRTINASGIVTTGNKYYVDINGSGDYTSFTACLKALQNDDSEKTIYVREGIYDIFEELGGVEYLATITDPANTNWRDVQPIVPQNTHIVGLGQVTLKFTPTAEQIGSQAMAFLFSPLNLSGTCEIENIDIVATNCRYAIHQETSSLAKYNESVQKLKNVRAKRTIGTYGHNGVNVNGIGARNRWEYESCSFEGDTTLMYSVHTNSGVANDMATIIMNNCLFVSSAPNASAADMIQFVSGEGHSTTRNIAILNNCYCNGKLLLFNNTGSSQKWDVTLNGSTIQGVDISSGIVDNPYPVKQYPPSA